MKKDNVIILITFFILFYSFLISNPDIINIAGKSIFDIKATYESLSLRINIDNSAPDITLYYPLNETYNHKGNISLNYHASDLYSDISKIWYNLDNGANITLTGNTTLSINNEGSHILYIFANDSLGFLNNSVEYSIEDNNKSIIYKESEVKSVENVMSYIKKIKLFSDIPVGDYIFYVKVRYNNDIAIVSNTFKILEEQHIEKPRIEGQEQLYVLLIIISIIVLILVIYYYEKQRMERLSIIIKKANLYDLYKRGLIKSKNIKKNKMR